MQENKMTIKESLEQLDEILDKTEESVIKDSFEDIAEVLEIETDEEEGIVLRQGLGIRPRLATVRPENR